MVIKVLPVTTLAGIGPIREVWNWPLASVVPLVAVNVPADAETVMGTLAMGVLIPLRKVMVISLALHCTTLSVPVAVMP